MNPKFHNPIAEALVNALFTGQDRKLLRRGVCPLPTTKEEVSLTRESLEQLRGDLARVEKQVQDHELMLTLADTLAALTNGAEGPDLLDWNDE